MISEEDIALIDRFLAGELDGLEKVEFERRVKNDLEFAKEIRFQQKVVDNLKVVGAAQMAASVKADFSQWKAEGFEAYKPPKGMSTVAKVIIGVVAAGAIAAAIYFLTKKPAECPNVLPTETEVADSSVQENVEVLPSGPGTPPSTTPDTITQSVTRMVGAESNQKADLQLDVKDASTFNVELINTENGLYTYEISYDGKKQTIESDDPNLKETLMNRAKQALQPSPAQ